MSREFGESAGLPPPIARIQLDKLPSACRHWPTWIEAVGSELFAKEMLSPFAIEKTERLGLRARADRVARATRSTFQGAASTKGRIAVLRFFVHQSTRGL